MDHRSNDLQTKSKLVEIIGGCGDIWLRLLPLKSTFITQTVTLVLSMNRRPVGGSRLAPEGVFMGLFTPVSCVFEEAGGQFDNEYDPEERPPNCPFILTSRCFSGGLKLSRTAEDAFVCSSQTFPRVEFVRLSCARR